MSMQSDWEIKSRAHACARTGREFAAGDFYFTLLFRDGEGFRREEAFHRVKPYRVLP